MEVKEILIGMAEENVKAIIEKVLIPGAEEFIKESDNTWDDAVLPFLPQLKEFLLAKADLIDGKVGE